MAGAALISIVDDDAWARDGLEDLIVAIGYEARAFASAEAFVESGSIAETACLITDLNMPGMSAFDLQARLRSAGHRTPIIMMTGDLTETVRSRALQDPATSVLTKPFREQALIDCLTRMIAPKDEP